MEAVTELVESEFNHCNIQHMAISNWQSAIGMSVQALLAIGNQQLACRFRLY